MTYAIAHGLRGFRSSSLRVRVERMGTPWAAKGYVWVRTADLSDAGTPLVLDISQLEPLDGPGVKGEEVWMHKTGLVAFA